MISELISLQGQTALVTGGSRGIGSAIALELARSGAYVVINYRFDEASANLVAEKIRHSGGQATVKGFDVSDSQAVDRAIAETVQERNGIDILVSNAGITRDGLIGRMKDTDWNEVVSTNLSGVFYLCRSVSKNMIRRRKGRIITISSTAGEAGNPGQANYSAAKAGLIGFTKALARELAPRNILVNSVSPGIIAGGMTDQLTEDQLESIRSHVPLRRTGKPEEVAAAVLFLCSGMSEYITGQVIRVNGGLYM
jgi:3-oxoacyl-[acyl-carrier protein] reductase